MTPRIALVTARAARGTDPDMPPLLAALLKAGADAQEVDWDDDGVDWSRFGLTLLRSTWDYAHRAQEFLDWAARVAEQTHLQNPLAVVRWNSDKHYLAELARSGVPVVPSTFVEPDEEAEAAVDAFLPSLGNPPSRGGAAETGDFVVKPAVGAGSRDAQRHGTEDREQAIAHVRRLLDQRRAVLLQPYLRKIDEEGETALLFFEGAFSHAVRKAPLLRRGEAPTTELYAKETIAPCEASPAELEVAQHALAAIPFERPLLYARIDLIRDDHGSPVLLELELVEPSVFAGFADGAAERFARAILARAGNR
jgi:glutathione synthase/RimK-type ligase-like ATP-grasp enzyme